jgi:hypothetical protein
VRPVPPSTATRPRVCHKADTRPQACVSVGRGREGLRRRARSWSRSLAVSTSPSSSPCPTLLPRRAVVEGAPTAYHADLLFLTLLLLHDVALSPSALPARSSAASGSAVGRGHQRLNLLLLLIHEVTQQRRQGRPRKFGYSRCTIVIVLRACCIGPPTMALGAVPSTKHCDLRESM